MKFKHNIANLQALNFMHGLSLKVGILGGTFDPAHSGHVIISEQALNFYHFDFVIWLVANQNPIKPSMQRDIFLRAQSALKVVTHPKIIVSTAEYDLNSCYSYDSVRLLVERYKTVKFSWLMGMDNVNTFRKWYRSADLIKLCNILVFDRPCYTRLLNVATIGLKPKANLAKNENNHIMIHRGKLCGLSSTQLRDWWSSKAMSNNSEDIKDFILKCLEEKKAENITCIPLKGEVPIADYMIFASGRSIKNIKAIAEYTAIELKHELKWNASVEGLAGSDWILLDAGDVIVHLFHPEARDKFKVEELWENR